MTWKAVSSHPPLAAVLMRGELPMANDFLIRFAANENPEPALLAGGAPDRGIGVEELSGLSTSQFSVPSLQSLAPDSEVRERLSVLRIDPNKLPTPDLVTFGARNRSNWALDALSQRLTFGLLDWAGFRAELVRAFEAKRDYEPVIDRIAANDLWWFRQTLHSHHLDDEVERVLLIAVAERVLAGEKLDQRAVTALAVNLVGVGLDDLLRQLLRIDSTESYVRHALLVELEHPRFGGSHDLLLARFNQMYRRFGLEAIELSGEGSVPFTRLRAHPAERIDSGPLVTVIMSCWSPGEEILLAVQSVIDQTYQNWELIVTDDASPEKHAQILGQVAAMDPRIRVVRNDVNGGTYIRRNEALARARGEFVTMQDSDDWSHPRRLEIQVRDLESRPERYANIVRNVRLTEDLSLYSERGMQLGLCEPAIFFRRATVLEKIGFFDDVRKAADREFRQRLEAATGVPVATVGPEVPLVLMLADVSSLSGSDFRGKWVHPARVAYRSSMRRFHHMIKDGECSPLLPPRQESRTLHAPTALLGHNTAPERVDLLVVLDGRPSAERRHFIAEVVQEAEAAIDAGYSVGVLHADSLTGGKELGYFDASMQHLVDNGHLHRILEDQPIDVGTVVVRHAGAVQGHQHARRPVSAERVVVVEDRNGGDERGVTFAKRDVVDTAREWFGVAPEWFVAAARPLPPAILSVAVDGADMRVALAHWSADCAVSLELQGARTTPVGLSVRAGELVDPVPREMSKIGRVALDEVGYEPFAVVARIGSYTYRLDVDVTQVLATSTAPMLMRRPHQQLQLLDAKSSVGSVDSYELRRDLLRASVTAVGLQDERVVLEIETSEKAKLVEVVVIRDVGGVLRRREFVVEDATLSTTIASRSFQDIAGARWRVYGVFETPTGRIQYPIDMSSAPRTNDVEGWWVRLSDDQTMCITPT